MIHLRNFEIFFYRRFVIQHVHCHIMPRREGDFEHNDQIYIELNKHDHDEEQHQRRSLEERAAEADAYRTILESFSAFGENGNKVN